MIHDVPQAEIVEVRPRPASPAEGKRPTAKPLVEPAFIAGPIADAFVDIR